MLGNDDVWSVRWLDGLQLILDGCQTVLDYDRQLRALESIGELSLDDIGSELIGPDHQVIAGSVRGSDRQGDEQTHDEGACQYSSGQTAHGCTRDQRDSSSRPRRRAERAFWREERMRRRRLTSMGSSSSAAGRSIRLFRSW